MLALVVFSTVVAIIDFVVLLTEALLTVLAFERQKVDEGTLWMRALFANSHKLRISFRRCGHGIWWLEDEKECDVGGIKTKNGYRLYESECSKLTRPLGLARRLAHKQI